VDCWVGEALIKEAIRRRERRVDKSKQNILIQIDEFR